MTDGRYRITRRMIRRLLPVAALVAALPADAQLQPDPDAAAEEAAPPRYLVEVIIFRYAEEVGVGSEIFVPEIIEFDPPTDPPVLDSDDLTPGARAATTPATRVPASDDADAETADQMDDGDDAFHYELLPEDALALTETWRRLGRLDVYEPMLHVGWMQTALEEDMTPALALTDLATTIPNGLDGTLTLYLSRFLHLVVDVSLAADEGNEFAAPPGDIVYDEPAVVYGDNRVGDDPAGIPREPVYAPLRYEISEDRILKSGELRYYDHPKFGVLARIERVEEPEEEVLDEAAFDDETAAGASGGS